MCRPRRYPCLLRNAQVRKPIGDTFIRFCECCERLCRNIRRRCPPVRRTLTRSALLCQVGKYLRHVRSRSRQRLIASPIHHHGLIVIWRSAAGNLRTRPCRRRSHNRRLYCRFHGQTTAIEHTQVLNPVRSFTRKRRGHLSAVIEAFQANRVRNRLIGPQQTRREVRIERLDALQIPLSFDRALVMQPELSEDTLRR